MKEFLEGTGRVSGTQSPRLARDPKPLPLALVEGPSPSRFRTASWHLNTLVDQLNMNQVTTYLRVGPGAIHKVYRLGLYSQCLAIPPINRTDASIEFDESSFFIFLDVQASPGHQVH